MHIWRERKRDMDMYIYIYIYICVDILRYGDMGISIDIHIWICRIYRYMGAYMDMELWVYGYMDRYGRIY